MISVEVSGNDKHNIIYYSNVWQVILTIKYNKPIVYIINDEKFIKKKFFKKFSFYILFFCYYEKQKINQFLYMCRPLKAT